MTSAQPPDPGLVNAVRAGAAGLYPLEAACELIIGTGWLHRDDFARFITTGTSLPDGVTELGVSVRLLPSGTRDCVILGQQHRLRAG